MERLSACIACRAPSERAPVVHRRRDDALVRCPACGVLFANPQYTPDELEQLYRTEYYDEHKNLDTDYREKDYLLYQPLYRATLKDLLRRYPRLRQSAGRAVNVLDFGSGVGFFLDACQKHGMAPLGIDFSDVAARYAKQRFALTVLTDPDRALASLPSEKFELVTAWQVIEHLRRPRETLAELARVLAPGGVLCVAVPNLRSWQYRLQGARWFNVQNLTHLSFFNRRNLGLMLEGAGLTRIVRPVLWGGRARPSAVLDLAQWAVRLANLGNELRLYAEKPGRA